MGTTSEKLTYLNETKQELKQAINNLGGEITDNTTFRNYANQLQNVYDNLPKTEYQEGTSVTLEGLKGKIDFDTDNGKKIVGYGDTEQDGEPTPTNEVPIQCVTGNQSIVESGKNLINLNNSENGGIDASGSLVDNTQNWRGTEYMPVKPNTQYTFSTIGYNGIVYLLRLYEFDENKNFISPRSQGDNSSTLTMTTTSNTKYLKWTIFLTNTDITTEIVNSMNLMLTKGTDTTYEPYHTPITYPISLGSLELCKIGTYQDYIYKNEGNWYVHKNTIKINLSTITSYVRSSGWENLTAFVADSVFNHGYSGYATVASLFCNRLIADTPAHISSSAINAIGLGRNTSVYISVENITTSDALITYFSQNPTYLYAPLATATNTPITDTTLLAQLEAWYNAQSFDGTTNIESNGDLPMIIKVRALKGE